MSTVPWKGVLANPYVWTKAAAFMAFAYINLGLLLPYVLTQWQDAHTVSTFTVTPAVSAELAESLAQAAARHYLDAGQGAQIAAFVRKAAHAGEYDAFTTPGEITRALSEDMHLANGDLHTSVEFSAPEVPETGEDGARGPGNDAALPLPLRLIDRLGRSLADFGVADVGESAAGIATIRLTGFFPAFLAAEKYAAAMDRVAGSRALIIDLRRNGGGKPDGATLLASYFFDRPVHLADLEAPRANQRMAMWTRAQVDGKRYGSTRPVLILTSRVTATAAEYFAYTMQAQKRALVVGEATRGATQPLGRFRLAPHFVVDLPVARVVSPVTHANWEGKGVQPDVATRAGDALDVATALLLRGQLAAENDPARRARIRKWLSDAQ